MDSPQEAQDYDSMNHHEVNQRFAADFLGFAGDSLPENGSRPARILDVGAGTAQIPIAIVRQSPTLRIVAIDLAEEMLKLARRNLADAGMEDAIRVECVDAKRMPYPDGEFDAVVSNSIVHHIPEPLDVFREMRRVVRPGGVLFVRDLLRPRDMPSLNSLVDRYAANENEHQRSLFRDSLHAALSMDEVRRLLATIGLPESAVVQTSDRHWTVGARV